MTMQTGEVAMPTSKYREIVEAIIAQIDGGILRAGDQIPSTAELARQFRCSVMPVKQAVNELKLRGYVVGAAGIGVFVARGPKD